MRYTIYQFKGSGKYFYVYNGTPKLISKILFKSVKNLVETTPVSLDLMMHRPEHIVEVASCDKFSDLLQTHPELFI